MSFGKGSKVPVKVVAWEVLLPLKRLVGAYSVGIGIGTLDEGIARRVGVIECKGMIRVRVGARVRVRDRDRAMIMLRVRVGVRVRGRVRVRV